LITANCPSNDRIGALHQPSAPKKVETMKRPQCQHFDDMGENPVQCPSPATHVIVHRNPKATVLLVEGVDHFAGRKITPETLLHPEKICQ
jgi:hypothetical protein